MRKTRLTITAGLIAGATAAAATRRERGNRSTRRDHRSQLLRRSSPATRSTSNGLKLVAGTWRGLPLPDLSGAIPAVPPDSVASGLDMSQFVTGGYQTAEAMVWDDTVHAGACGAGAWTLEYNPVLFNTGTVTPMPVPVGALQPVNPGSTAYPFCITGAGNVFLFEYHSNAHHLTLYLAGTGSSQL